MIESSVERQTVLVVGGNGFVGSHIVDALLEAGHRVRVLSPHPELFRPPNPAVAYHFGRLELASHLEPAVEGCDAVVDSVSSAVPASADASPASTIATAVGASTWLAELSVRAGVRAHIYLSSGGTVYGPAHDERPHLETDAIAPIGTYGALKAGSELALAAMLRPTSTRLVILRVANAYGERQNPSRPQGIVGVALARLASGEPLTMYGDTIRDLVHAADVGTSVVRAVGPDMTGTYNVGSGAGTAMSDVLGRIERLAGKTLTVERREARSFDVGYSVVDIARARAAGWSPQIDLDEGLRRTYEWYRTLAG